MDIAALSKEFALHGEKIKSLAKDAEVDRQDVIQAIKEMDQRVDAVVERLDNERGDMTLAVNQAVDARLTTAGVCPNGQPGGPNDESESGGSLSPRSKDAPCMACKGNDSWILPKIT